MTYQNGIKSEHYFGPSFKPEEVRAISKDVVKQGEPAKSSITVVPVSFSTYPYGESSPTIIGDYAFMKSGGNRLNSFHKSDFEKYGLATHWEDSASLLESFKFAGEGVMPIMFDVIPKNPNFGYIEGITPLGLYLPHYSDTKMRDIRTTPRLLSADDPDKEGYNVSRTQNFRQAIRDSIWTDTQSYRQEFTDWIQFLAEKGFSAEKARSPGIHGLGTLNTEAIAAYLPEIGYLVRGNQFSDLNEIDAHDPELGVALKRYAIYHEIAHHLGVRGGRRNERLQGLLQEEFYAKQAKKHAGTRMERVYKLLSESGREYAKAFSFWSNLLKEQPSNSLFESEPARQFMEKFQKEAEAYGLSGKEAETYINKRVKNVFGVFFDTKEDHLEGIVQTAYEQASGVAENEVSSQNYQRTTIDGKVVSMPKYQSKGKNEGEKGKVLDGKDKFGKPKYDGRKEESDARNADAESSSKEAESKGESPESGGAGQGEATAEAA